MSSIKHRPDDLSAPERFDLLIRLLKMGSLINNPMKAVVCDPSGISQVELKVIMALAGEGDLAGHELVKIMGMPAMNVSRAIASLREAGLIEEVADPDNKRRKPVRLSSEGQAVYARLMPDIAAVASALLGHLSARQRRDFVSAADVIIAAMASWSEN